MEENTPNEEPSSLKTLFSFILSAIYILFGCILYPEYPNIAFVIRILGIVGLIVTVFYLVIKSTTWSLNITQKAKEYFLLWLEIAYTLLFISVIAFTIRFFVIQPFMVKGESMEPNYKNGEYLIVNEISYHLGVKPKRGNVIVFKYPRDPKESYIKRIIGLPEEKVEIKDDKLYISKGGDPQNTELKEDYLPYVDKVPGTADQEWSLDKDEYFVLGDNRLPGGSSDSRMWGPLPRKNIIGKVWFVFWPPGEFKTISLPQYNL